MERSRKICVDILEQILSKDAYSNIVLRNTLNKYNLQDNDKALVTEIVYGTIKYKYTIDTILNHYLKKGIKSIDTYTLNILRSAVYQIMYLDKVPNFAAVNEAVEIAKKYRSIGTSKLVNGVLRNYLRNLDKVYYNENDKIEALCFKYSFEKWLVKMLISQYNYEITEKILKGLNEKSAVTVRINSLKTNYDEAFKKLLDYRYNVEKGYVSHEAIVIKHGKNIEENPLFKEGMITVQDESAMMVAPSMEVKPGFKVLDLCSAPGGKTTHIAELMKNTGVVKAFDIHENKLSLVEQNAKRLGINNIVCSKLDASIYCDDFKDSADAVLIDVPCSGFGIIRKKPEIKYTKSMKELSSIVELQRRIMINAAKYVKLGGTLVYSTCTLNKKENEDNIDWFLNKFPQYSIDKLYYGDVKNIIYNDNGSVTILPNQYMDGFFISRLKRIR